MSKEDTPEEADRSFGMRTGFGKVKFKFRFILEFTEHMIAAIRAGLPVVCRQRCNRGGGIGGDPHLIGDTGFQEGIEDPTEQGLAV